MVSVQDIAICPTCGEEYWYDLDCRTCEYTKLSMSPKSSPYMTLIASSNPF